MRAIRYGSAALIATAAAWALWSAPARAAEVRISAPASLTAGKPCRITVTVGSGVRGTAVLQQRSGSRWRTISTARLKRRSARLRCPTARRAGHTRRFRALVRANGRTIARSRTVSVRTTPAPPVTAPGDLPKPLAPRPPAPGPPGAPAPKPLDPAQFGMEGTGGPPGAAALALLTNPNVVLDADGVADIRAGRIDPRIVAVLTKLAETHAITVSTLCSDHPKFTSGGAVSNHFYGRGMDIAAIDGVPVSPANTTAHAVATGLSTLDPGYRPDEVGSPWAISAPGHFTDAANQDTIHVAFKRPVDPGWKPPT